MSPKANRHIDAFIDLVSPYSYFATHYLLSQRTLLASHATTLTFHPVYLGAIQVATKNIPPFQIPAKARYSTYDTPRAARHFGVPYAGAPPWFPMASLKVQRVLTVVREWDERVFERVLLALFEAVWVGGSNLGEEGVLRDVLGRVFGEVGREGEVEGVMRRIGERDVKEKLTETTNWAMELGAFGMPFFSVTNAEGEREPFFGSDRFEYMFEFLGLPLQKMRIREGGEGGESKL